MGKARKKPRKKWTPPAEWPIIEINPSEIFLAGYKNYSIGEFRTVRTRLALDSLNVLVIGGEKYSSRSMTWSLQSSTKKYFFELGKYPAYNINYKKLDSIDFRLRSIDQKDIERLNEFTDGPNTRETARRLLRSFSPIFSEGVLYGNKISHIVYFKVLENTEDEIKVHLRKLSFVDDDIVYGDDEEEAYRHHPNLVNYTVEYEADFIYEICNESGCWGVKCTNYNRIDQGNILRIVPPKETRFDRFQYELWKRTVTKVCDEEKVFENPELREKYGFTKPIMNRYDNLGKIFMLYMEVTNYLLWLQKKDRKYYSKKNTSGSNPVVIVDEMDPFVEDKKIRIIGDTNVRIHYTNEEDLDPDSKRSYTFRKQAWERKEFYRHYKNGKVVKVKATVCRRKGAPPDAAIQKTQNIIKVV